MKLTTRYMNLTLKNPLVASASPLSQRLDTIRQLEDRGASAIVMFSLFEEQIREDAAAMEYFMTVGTDSFGEALSYFPMIERCEVGPSQYLELIRKATAAVDIPIIASLNGTSDRGWVDFAALMEEAGAKAIELNIYYIPTAMHRTGAQIEEQYVDVVARVKSAVSVPVAVKVGPYFSSFAHMAGRLDRAGANSLVLFNRFYQPDFDIETRTVVPSLALSTPDEIRLPLLWIALLHGNLDCSLAATTGVHSAVEVIKYLMAGADVVMSTSALLRCGPSWLATTLADLTDWMDRKGYETVDQLRGSMSHKALPESMAFVRGNYIRILESYKPGAPAASRSGDRTPGAH
jgi:dihydroorotate dehydrogenase (fumarate)